MVNQALTTPVHETGMARAPSYPGFFLGDQAVANKNNITPPERSKVRLVMVEFDGPSGDLQQLAQTLANAVKPQQIVVQAPTAAPLLAPAHLPVNALPQNGVAQNVFDAVTPELPQNPVPEPPLTKSPNGTKRKMKTPNLISDLDFNSDPKPFKAYIAEIDPQDHQRRYLAITQWLKEYRQIEEAGADHIYTCYRFLDLSVPDDMTVTFRKLKALAWVERGSARGMYKITHIGENQLTEARKKE
jgi:hypothetical protein